MTIKLGQLVSLKRWVDSEWLEGEYDGHVGKRFEQTDVPSLRSPSQYIWRLFWFKTFLCFSFFLNCQTGIFPAAFVTVIEPIPIEGPRVLAAYDFEAGFFLFS